MKILVITIVYLLPFFVAGLYYSFFGHRTDYLGHYLAGFGGTFAVTISFLGMLSPSQYLRWFGNVVILLLFLSIGFGTLLEATVFRIAKFDEVDYANQNLGAILAALCALVIMPKEQPKFYFSLLLALTGIGFLLAGFHYAFL